MWWILYFCVYLSVTVLAVVGVFTLPQYSALAFGPYEVLGIFLNLSLLFATYAYIFTRGIFEAGFWKCAFWGAVFLIIVWLLELFVLPQYYMAILMPILQTRMPISDLERIICLIVGLPALYAMYRMSRSRS
ncbi:hypothetical protein HY522_10580 [bacterium]|nr:hypothetical protein [bacterium]